MPINTVYPLDLSGTAIDNRIVGEAKHIAVDPDRVFIPTGGPFYTKSLRVKRSGVLLSPFTDYKCLELNVDGTLASGKEVCNVILISAAGADFTIDYQVIGGEYSDLSNELASLIANTPLNQLGVLEWGGIVNKPLKYPPSIHYHFPFEWRGYTGVLAQLEAMRQAIISSDSSSLSTIFTFIQDNIQYITSEYLSANALIYIDHNPTPSGNVLLKGNGTQASPLGLDLNELFQEFDLRYLRNVMSPVSRIGMVADYFLPISSGFFNNLIPYTKELLSQAIAGEVERNGDLVLLLPATNGEAIRYVYGIVKGWTTLPRIDRFKPTNQQYTPPGLAANEAIMDILNCNEQSMFAKIFTINPDGSFVFKEYCIIWLNGTMYQEKHIVQRIGLSIASMIGSQPPRFAQRMGFNFFKIKGVIYLLRTKPLFTLSMYTFDPGANVFTEITNWTGYHDKTVLAPATADFAEETVVSHTRTLYKTGQSSIKPFSFFKTLAEPDEYWVCDNVADSGPGWTRNLAYSVMGRQVLRFHIVGEKIHVDYGIGNDVYFFDANGLRLPKRYEVAMGLTIEPTQNPPVYDWLRIRSDRIPGLTNPAAYRDADQTNETFDAANWSFKYTIPADMCTYVGLTYGDIVPISVLGLKDGTLLFLRSPGLEGKPCRLDSFAPTTATPPNYPLTKLFQPYYFCKWAARGTRVYTNDIVLPEPTVNGIGVTVIPLNDNIQLVRRVASDIRGNTGHLFRHSLYRPSASVMNYLTADSGTIQGYASSNDRKEIADQWAFPVVSSRLADGTCRVSNLVFHRYKGSSPTQGDMVRHRDITADYSSGQVLFNNPVTMPQSVADSLKERLLIEFSELGDPQFWSWYLLVSPTDISTGLLHFHAKNSLNLNGGQEFYSAQIVYDANNVMTSIVLGNRFKHNRPDNTYQIAIYDQGYSDTRMQWAIQYSADLSTATWFGRAPGADATVSDTTPRVAIWRVDQNYDGNSMPQFTYIGEFGDQKTMGGYKTVVATSRGVGVLTDFVGYGAYRALQTFNLGTWGSTGLFSSDPKFLYYTPRPPAAFNVLVTDRIEVQLGGVQSAIEAGTYSLTDPLYSTITDPSNKTIFVYIVLELGQPRLHFSATALADTVSVVYIGKIVTDSVGVMQSDLRPVSRIDSYRPSATPQGSSFSVSSGTADMFQRLNWDANIPEDDSAPPDPEPVYNIMANKANVDEGDNVTFTLTAYNVTPGTLLPWTITGVSPVDVSSLSSGNPTTLTGSWTSDNFVSFTASVTVTLADDVLTEGAENLTLGLTNGLASATVIVNDTSIPPVVPDPPSPEVVLKFTENQQNANSPIESPDVIGLTSVDPDAPFWMNVRLFNLPDNVPIPINFAWLTSGLLQYKLNGGTDEWAELLDLNWSAGVKPAGVAAYTYSLQLRVNPTTVSNTGSIIAQATVNGTVSNSVGLTVETGERYLASQWYNTPIVGGGTIDASPYLEERIGNDPFYLGITYKGMPVGATAQIEFDGAGQNSYYQRWNGSVWVDVENGETFTIPTTHTELSIHQYYTLNVQFRLTPGSDTGLHDLISCDTTMAEASSWSSLITVKSQA